MLWRSRWLSPPQAQDKSLTLCWAAWDPANALVELCKDFTAKTGIEMKFEFVPWTNFADRLLNELNSHGKLCDLMIGDSQWIGGSARTATTSSSTTSSPRTTSRWRISCRPRSTPTRPGPRARRTTGRCRPWATRSAGSTARTGSPGPELQAEFKKKYGRDLAPPATWTELKQIAEFFQGREIDGKKVYGAAIFTERGSEGITMGVTDVLYAWGFQYENPNKPYDMDGFVNSPDAVEGARVLQGPLRLLHAARATPTPTCRKASTPSSRARWPCMMNWFAFFPGLYKDPDVGGDKIGFFVNPTAEGRGFARSAGRASRWWPTPTSRRTRSNTSSGSPQPDVQKKWWSLGGYLLLQGGAARPGFPTSAPVRRRLPEGDGDVKDFWQEPAYAELLLAMQKRVHDYVVADQGTAQQALDLLVKDWTEVFQDEGKL